MKRIKHQYLTLSGWPGDHKQITLMEGNLYGERALRVVASLPANTSYQDACGEAKRLAAEMGIRLGRDFTQEEWEGKL